MKNIIDENKQEIKYLKLLCKQKDNYKYSYEETLKSKDEEIRLLKLKITNFEEQIGMHSVNYYKQKNIKLANEIIG